MVNYTASKFSSVVNPEWIFWSKNEFGQDLAPKQVSSLLFITRKKEICLIYKPTPVFNDRNKLTAIIGNMFNESSSPGFFKTDKDDIGFCYAIRAHNTAPTEFRPEIPLHAKLVKDTDWDDVEMEIALIAIPTIAPPPFGKEISSSISDDDFMEERKSISDGHGFGAQTLINVIDQFEVNNHTKKVLKRIISSPIISTSPDPAHATTKGIRGMTFTSSPFPDTLLTKKNSYEVDQDNLQAFYRHNPTPARASNNHNVN